MAYHTKPFSQQSIQLLSNDIDAFLTATPAATAIAVTITVEGAGFFAILLYDI